MKSSDRTILVGILILGVMASFWFFLLAPKREDASELGRKITEAESRISSQQAIVDASRAAQDGYEESYQTLVVLGKAAPEDSDTPALLTQLQSIADDTKVDFNSLVLEQDGSAVVPAAAATTTDQSKEDGAAPAEPNPSTAPAVPVAATEASASTLPLGATVGPAGLPVMPYALTLQGGFFEMADFLAKIDRLVEHDKARLSVDGRLVTIDGFTMAPFGEGPSGSSDGDDLQVELNVTTYLVPSSQGIDAGATAAAPPAAVPTAAPAPTSQTPAASVTP